MPTNGLLPAFPYPPQFFPSTTRCDILRNLLLMNMGREAQVQVPLTPIRFMKHPARIFGDKVGVVCGDKRLTYRELNDRSDRLSAALVRLGIQGGDRVAFLSFNCHRLLEAYYGVPQIGAILLPLNIRLSPEELAYILGDSTPQVLIFDPEFTPLVEDLRSRTQTVRTYITMHGSKPSWANNESLDELLAASARADFDWTSIDEDSVAELFYTSGTTAYPKDDADPPQSVPARPLHGPGNACI